MGVPRGRSAWAQQAQQSWALGLWAGAPAWLWAPELWALSKSLPSLIFLFPLSVPSLYPRFLSSCSLAISSGSSRGLYVMKQCARAAAECLSLGHARQRRREESQELVRTKLGPCQYALRTSLWPMSVPTIKGCHSIGGFRSASHGRSGVQAKHYDRYSYLPEKRAALEQWGRYLDGLATGEESPRNVVLLTRARKKSDER